MIEAVLVVLFFLLKKNALNVILSPEKFQRSFITSFFNLLFLDSLG